MARRLRQLILAFFCVVPAAWSADPLVQLVTIYRDNYGVPHIVGETEPAAFFGYGYAQAQDHLKRMMLQCRDARRRRSVDLWPASCLPESLRLVPGEYRWGGDSLQRLLRT